MAFFVTAEADIPGRWDRNALHLGPGRTLRLTFTPREPGNPYFLLRDLYSATVRRQA
jgi:beta-mannosidase